MVAGANKGFRKIWFLDAQWSDVPRKVEDQVRDLWCNKELGNDRYIYKTTVNDLIEDGYSLIAEYVLEQQPEIDKNERFIIHWWW